MTRLWAGPIMAAAMALGLAPGQGTAEESPVRVVFIGGFTGPLAQNLAAIKIGVDAAAADLNSRGGILGRPVEVVNLDSGGDPTKTVSLFQQYVSRNDKPQLVLAGNTSNEALALTPLFTRQKVISFAPGAHQSLNDPKSYPYHFGIAVTTDRLQEALPHELERMGVKRLAIVTPLDAYGSSIVKSISDVVGAAGIEVKAYQFDPKDLDVTGIFDRAIADAPDAFYIEGNGDVVQRMARARVEVNGTHIPLIFGNSAGATNGGHMSWASGDALKNVRVQTTYVTRYADPDDYSEPQKRFFGNAAEGVMDKGISIVGPAYFFDSIQIYASAAEQAGSVDPDKVKAVLESDGFAVPELITWSDLGGYSADRHFPNPPLEDFVFIGPSPVVMGMFKPADH
ncbi:MAG: ABC transporter substrate-binding protein [Paracoccus sp. (in: a-proteobacteria)]|uniref:ABC transporter substrate-binding protein n=1 Tax=Paracoccus sp. TaxID=267 RepID=UPI0039E42C80